MAKIRLNISCSNLAPLQSLNSSLELSSLRIAIFAHNGTGKTFISRALELAAALKSKRVPLFPTKSLISFGHTNTSFKLEIFDKEGNKKENLNLGVTNEGPSLTSGPTYIYHVFNQDYIEQNIECFQYDKDPNVQGYILGEANIDLSNEEASLKEIERTGKELRAYLEKFVSDYLSTKINQISNITRLQEYKSLSVEEIINFSGEIDENGVKSLEECFENYNKIKSVPQQLSSITALIDFKEFESLNDIKLILREEYSITNFAEELRNTILQDRFFFERGVNIYNNHNKSICPFCHQTISEDSSKWIDSIIAFFKDKEAIILNSLCGFENGLKSYVEYLNNVQSEYIQAIQQYNEYRCKYFSNLSEVEATFNPQSLISVINSIIELINKKKDNIAHPISLPDIIESELSKFTTNLKEAVSVLNIAIKNANNSISTADKLNKEIRRDILRSARNQILNETAEKRKRLNDIRIEYKELSDSINIKRNAIKTERKGLIVSIIRKVLNYFFSDKYSFDEETFRLSLRNQPLLEKEAKHVLSEGEKSIVAFAYFVGDTITHINSESDYNKLFFIYDDPISSMDYDYVYTLVDVIREMPSIFNKMGIYRFIALTHNNDFMRILAGNDVTKDNFYLDAGSLNPLNENFSVPYISHLKDIYQVSIGKLDPSHTTPNSIRHIIETIMKWTKLEASKSNLKEFIKEAFSDYKKNYTLINDLSHGGWRTEQQPITREEIISICKDIISYINSTFPDQIRYCANLYK